MQRIRKKLDILNNIRTELMLIGIYKPKPNFITAKEVREIMLKGEYMPTAIFSATQKDYIVKTRTIFGPKVKTKKKGLRKNV